MRSPPVLACFIAFLGGTLLTFSISNMLDISLKMERRTRSTQDAEEQIPSHVPELRVLDELNHLKNEVHRLYRDDSRLQSLLDDLNATIVDLKKMAIDPIGDLNSMKDSIQKFLDTSTKQDEHMHHELNTKEGRDHLTEKTFKAFRYVYKHYFNDYDWFMRVDDDGFVIMENLRYFLSGQDTKSPIYFGHKFKAIVKQGYFAGGPGIVLSKEALHRFSTKGLEVCCNETNWKFLDDVNIGFCMETLGVAVGTSLDSLGRTRFHCFNPQTHLLGSYPNWFLRFDAYGAKKGMANMSDYAIGFHYVSPEMCYLMDYAVYHLQPYGLHFVDQDLNVPVK